MISRNACKASFPSNMTGEGAQIGLWFTVALTFTASTIFIILRSYIRGKAELWSDWLNGKFAPFPHGLDHVHRRRR